MTTKQQIKKLKKIGLRMSEISRFTGVSYSYLTILSLSNCNHSKVISFALECVAHKSVLMQCIESAKQSAKSKHAKTRIYELEDLALDYFKRNK